ncbi:MAG TPA: cation diffusion facilitator family transporter [Xanthobacteraceae bacterium]|jgi:cation diffusion facilitator family transporter|nr:cation diffusion facilitator family transporter [Xanthobacteraceae bacterium]
MAAGSASRKVIYAALAGNLAIALTKFAAAWWTGSSAMLSEGVHSAVDTSNQLLLLYGIHRASLPADEDHPLGYGRELYFWSFIVALLIFALGAGVSFYEGIAHIQAPTHITNPLVNYLVLALSAVFEGSSFAIALREFNRTRGGLGYVEAVTVSKDPTSFLVLFEDSAALTGLGIAFAGTFAAEQLEMPVLDGVASIGIGAILAITAAFLARESKGLLIGEGARGRTQRSIREIAGQCGGVEQVNDLVTVHLAPEQVVAALSLEFRDPLTTPDIEKAVATIEKHIRERHPEVTSVFIKPQSSVTRSQRASAKLNA